MKSPWSLSSTGYRTRTSACRSWTSRSSSQPICNIDLQHLRKLLLVFEDVEISKERPRDVEVAEMSPNRMQRQYKPLLIVKAIETVCGKPSPSRHPREQLLFVEAVKARETIPERPRRRQHHRQSTNIVTVSTPPPDPPSRQTAVCRGRRGETTATLQQTTPAAVTQQQQLLDQKPSSDDRVDSSSHSSNEAFLSLSSEEDESGPSAA
ncbi:hypothetical protein QAD02_007916 [Eretmocerus hayati]|uniref:Uncharacterized protein n=1 Tax=Eretmocerus hayati TaxID=131215 RepID=A0ACC2N5C6_9HYME|nr:hypothetical protein QAD02_007916 [Eretmocerus hayati]